MPVLCRFIKRPLVPWASLLVCPLQHFQVPALRRVLARQLVPQAVVLAQRLQLFEISTARRCVTKVFLTRQATFPLPALQRTYTSELRGIILTKLLKLKPRRYHRVAHPTAHHWESREVCGIVKVLTQISGCA